MIDVDCLRFLCEDSNPDQVSISVPHQLKNKYVLVRSFEDLGTQVPLRLHVKKTYERQTITFQKTFPDWGPSPSHRGLSSPVPMGAPHHQRVYVHDSRTQNFTMGGDLVEYGMMFNQTQTFLDDAEGQAERCEGCKTKKNQACRPIHQLYITIG